MTSALGPSVSNLIANGAIKAPVQVRGEHKGKSIEAVIQPDGTFLFHGRTFNSPSVAAGFAITAITGATTPGRSYFSVNGWKFWKVAGADGSWRSLLEVRDSLSTG